MGSFQTHQNKFVFPLWLEHAADLGVPLLLKVRILTSLQKLWQKSGARKPAFLPYFVGFSGFMKIQIHGSFAFVPPYLAPAASVYFSAKMINARSIANKSFLLNDLFCREKLDFIFISKMWQRENEVAHLLGLCPGDGSFWGRNAVIFMPHFSQKLLYQFWDDNDKNWKQWAFVKCFNILSIWVCYLFSLRFSRTFMIHY